MDTDEEDNDLSRPSLGKRHTFFQVLWKFDCVKCFVLKSLFLQRSESTLCLGCSPPDPFSTPMADALPLADQPHLLTPNSRREELFAMPKSSQQQQTQQPTTNTTPSNSIETSVLTTTDSPLEYPPVCLGLSRQIRIQEDIPLPDLPLMPDSNTSTTALVPENDETPNDQTKVEVVRENHVVSTKVETNDDTKQSTNSRSGSPKPGPSREPTENEVYFKKTRHYYQKAEKDYEINRVQHSTTPVQQQEEPQDLSHTSNSCIKMDIDDLSEEEEADAELSPYETSNFSRRDNKSSNKDRFDENSRESSNVRPPIIVTRKKVQQAIEFATATVLAKSKKNSLAECEISNNQPKDPEFELPNEFFELSDEDSRSSAHNKGPVSNHIGGNAVNNASPGKSVIVRAGASVSKSFLNFVKLIYG